jgi:prophage maintenance system killer protein
MNEQDIINWNKLLTLKSNEPHSMVKQGIGAAIHRMEYYDDPIEKASALFHSLINNHHFLQANKRTALVGLLISLSKYEFDDDFLENLILDTVNQKLQVEDIAERIREEIQGKPSTLNETVERILVRYEKLIEKLFYI